MTENKEVKKEDLPISLQDFQTLCEILTENEQYIYDFVASVDTGSLAAICGYLVASLETQIPELLSDFLAARQAMRSMYPEMLRAEAVNNTPAPNELRFILPVAPSVKSVN